MFAAPRARSLALLSQNNRYGRMGIAEVARAAEAAGVPVVLREGFDSGTADFSGLAARTAAAKPEAIVVWSLYREGAGLVAALRAAGVTAPVFAGDGLVSPEFPRLAGRRRRGGRRHVSRSTPTRRRARATSSVGSRRGSGTPPTPSPRTPTTR